MRLLLLLSLLLGACETTSGPLPQAPAHAAGYTLAADQAAYAPGDTVTLTLHNGTDQPADTGVMGCATLEARTDAGWDRELPFNDRACILMAVLVEPGDDYSGEVVLDGVGEGTYRFTHSVSGVEVATEAFQVD